MINNPINPNAPTLNKKDNEDFSLFTVFFYVCMFLGLYVIINNILLMINNPEDIMYWLSMHSFTSLQLMIDTIIVIFVYTSLTNKLSKKFIFGTLFLLLYLNDKKYMVSISEAMVNLNVYWGLFRTGEGNTVTSFQYARITFVIIGLFTGVIGTFFLKRSILKVFVFIFTVAVYTSSVFLHYYVSFKPSLDASKTIGEQMAVVETSSNPLELCKYTNYKCYLMKKGEPYTYGEIRKQNLTTSVKFPDEKLAKEELDQVITKGINSLFENDNQKKYFHERTFNAKNFRAIVFNITRVDKEHVLVIQDNKEASRVTETYLLALNLYSYIFLFFWISMLTYMYNVHKNMNKKIKIEKLIA